MRSPGFLALRLPARMAPCSVPTMNLVGPACGQGEMAQEGEGLFQCANRHQMLILQ